MDGGLDAEVAIVSSSPKHRDQNHVWIRMSLVSAGIRVYNGVWRIIGHSLHSIIHGFVRVGSLWLEISAVIVVAGMGGFASEDS